MTAGFLARALFKPLVVAHPMFPATGMRGLATQVLCTGVPNIALQRQLGALSQYRQL